VGITILTVPLPFKDMDACSQYNAIQSWLHLEEKPEVILFGDDSGVKEFAEKYDLLHIPDVALNDVGLMSTADIFQKGQYVAKNDIVAYLDTDCILLPGFVDVIDTMAMVYESFLVVVYRKYMTYGLYIDFDDPNWCVKIKDYHCSKGGTFDAATGAGSDCFVFRKWLFAPDEMPPFSVGWPYWDGWKMGHALRKGAELIDASAVIYAIHQNHAYRKWVTGGKGWYNLALSGGIDQLAWVRDATVVL